MHIVPGFLIREIAGEIVAIPSGKAAHRLSGLIIINNCGRFLFNLLQQEQTEALLVDALMDEYDVDQLTAAADVADFLQILRDHNMLDDSCSVD